MNLQLTGHQLDITPAIRGYVTTKLERITRHFDHVIDVSVILSVDKLEQKVEANVHVPGGDIFCESSPCIVPISCRRLCLAATKLWPRNCIAAEISR